MKIKIAGFLLALLTFVTGVQVVLAQDMRQQNSIALAKLCGFINKQDAAGMYALTNENFQKAIGQVNFENYARYGIFAQGKVTDTVFVSLAEGVSAYKTTFSGAAFNVKIGADKDGKIGTLFFKKIDTTTQVRKEPLKSANPMLTKADKTIDEAAREYLEKKGTVGVSIGVLQNGVMRTYTYGETEKGSGEMPGTHSVYEIGSITKTFTATLLAWYVNTGKVLLNDPITKYLPDSVKMNEELKGITLQMLSNHTSGLPRVPDNLMDGNANLLNPYKLYNRKKLFSYLKRCKLVSAPGTVAAYSNLGAGLLGTLLEVATKKPYEKMLDEIIITPLKLDATGISLKNSEHAAQLLPVYNENGEKTPRWDFDALAGAGAVRSTSIDLLVYAQANLDLNTSPRGKALAMTQKITHEDEKMNIGLGWMLRKGLKYPVYWHNGGTYGSSSYIGFIPGKGAAVVVLSNCVQSVDEMAGKILNVLME